MAKVLALALIAALALICVCEGKKTSTQNKEDIDLSIEQRLLLLKKAELKAFLDSNNATCSDCASRQDLVQAALYVAASKYRHML